MGKNNPLSVKMKKVYIFISIFLVVTPFFLTKCCREWGWRSELKFVDSTYLQKKESYSIGDTVYILFWGYDGCEAPPEGNTIELSTRLSDDYELLILSTSNLGIDTIKNPQVGKMKIEGDTICIRGNNILEVNPEGDIDIVRAHSPCKHFPGSDSATVSPK